MSVQLPYMCRQHNVLEESEEQFWIITETSGLPRKGYSHHVETQVNQWIDDKDQWIDKGVIFLWSKSCDQPRTKCLSVERKLAAAMRKVGRNWVLSTATKPICGPSSSQQQYCPSIMRGIAWAWLDVGNSETVLLDFCCVAQYRPHGTLHCTLIQAILYRLHQTCIAIIA